MVPCPSCGGSSFDILLRPEEIEAEREWLREFYRRRVRQDPECLKDHVDFTQSDPTFVMGCVRCETVVRNPQPTPESLRRRYQLDDYGDRTLEDLDAGERGFFGAKADMLAADLPSGARVLEVGCFVGAFLDACVQRGWEATGVDLGEETAAFARAKGHKVIQADLRDVALPRNSFDAVFIWNTFDQIDKPAELLETCRTLLRAGGLLVLRVPNGLFERAAVALRQNPRMRGRVMLAQAYNNFLTFPYLVGYGPSSLAALLGSHGFKLERVFGDTILPLATPDTTPDAVEEERAVKRAVMRHCRREQDRTGTLYFPWIDVTASAL